MTTWAEPPDALTLSRDHVHLWKMLLNSDESELQCLVQLLADEERARAERFYFTRDRRRFISAHGQLRLILSRYVGVDPSALVFSYGQHGKPFFASPLGAGPIRFNLSHSGEMALAGLTREREIGVDIEELRTIEDIDRIQAHFFSARENAGLRALDEAEKPEAFFRCWTRKEAYLKATGDGLARATTSFDVTFARDAPACLLNVEGQPDEASRWSFQGLVPESGYIAAVAVEGEFGNLMCWSNRFLASD